MRKLQSFARNPEPFNGMFRPLDVMEFVLAPQGTLKPNNLGYFDFVSGGAITNAALYAMSRIPEVTGYARAIESNIADNSNLNRYAFLRYSDVSKSKASLLASMTLGGLSIAPIEARSVRCDQDGFDAFAPRVLDGVDHIPTCWNAQKENPEWLGIGVTTHWSAMASFHCDGLACAGCLQPIDELTDGPIPTVAFVSFMAGLMLATYFVRAVSGEQIAANVQQTYLTPFHPETVWQLSISTRRRCPIGGYNIAVLS